MSDTSKEVERFNAKHGARMMACDVAGKWVRASDYDALAVKLAEVEVERDALKSCTVLHTDLSNHHNAVKCPYCNPALQSQIDENRAFKSRAEAADQRVVALVGAINDAIAANRTELNLGNYAHDDVCKLQDEAIEVWQILTAALAAMEDEPSINWRDDPEAIVEDDEPQIGRDYA